MESNRPAEAAQSLDQVDRARAALAGRAVTPWWYHPALAVLVAQHVLVQGADDRDWTLPSALLLVGGAVVLVAACRRTIGLSPATPTGPRSRNLLAFRVMVAVACIWAAALTHDLRVAAAGTLVAFIASIALGRRYDIALRADLLDSSKPFA